MRKIGIIAFALLALVSCGQKLDNSMFIPEYQYNKQDDDKKKKGSDVIDDLIQDKVDPNHIKVISFNVRVGSAKDGDNSWDNRKKAAINLLYKENPVVFGVQEALQAQLVYLRQQCPAYKDIGVGRDDGRNTGEHMSIFFNEQRVELEKWGTFWLSETPDVPSKGWDEEYCRSVTWAFFKDLANGTRFMYVNTHGPLNKTANAQAMTLLARKMAELNTEKLPSILTADFNIGPESANFAPIRQSMKNAREAAPQTDELDTYNGFGSGSGIIDHIWYNGFNALSYRTIRDTYLNVPYVSDHYPIVATLEVPLK